MLLRLERVHLHRDFGRRDEVGQEHELPAPQLRVAQVEILGERVVPPAAGVGNRRPPPDAGRTLKLKKCPARRLPC
jgi:hypothetical protein